MDDIEIDLDNAGIQAEGKLKVKNRFEQLSEKVILTSKERDEKAALATQLTAEKAELSKERDFYKDFSTNVSKYPNASEYQSQILEKVKAGYSTEDAMVSVLAKEGKLSPQAPKAPDLGTIEGGSAPTNFTGDKQLSDMTPAEKLAALGDADRAGALVGALRGR